MIVDEKTLTILPSSSPIPLKAYSLEVIFVTVSKSERFAEFLKRLDAAEPAADAQEALALISMVLDAVEDEMSSIPRNPERWQVDGRLYPPRSDAARSVPGHPELTRYRSRAHNTVIASSGAIQIRTIDGRLVFDKAGADGKWIPEWTR